MKWSAAEALSWISHGVAIPLSGWTKNTYSGVEEAQRKLRTALAAERVRARGRAEKEDPATGRIVTHGLFEDVPPDPFDLPDIEVVVGVHGDMVMPAHKRSRYREKCWRDLRFDDAEVKREWPKSPSAVAKAWMRKDAEQIKATIGKPGKRDDMVRRCMQATGCTRVQAQAAHKGLPSEFRRPPGKPPK
jgi:hypothetical protein